MISRPLEWHVCNGYPKEHSRAEKPSHRHPCLILCLSRPDRTVLAENPISDHEKNTQKVAIGVGVGTLLLIGIIAATSGRSSAKSSTSKPIRLARNDDSAAPAAATAAVEAEVVAPKATTRPALDLDLAVDEGSARFTVQGVF